MTVSLSIVFTIFKLFLEIEDTMKRMQIIIIKGIKVLQQYILVKVNRTKTFIL